MPPTRNVRCHPSVSLSPGTSRPDEKCCSELVTSPGDSGLLSASWRHRASVSRRQWAAVTRWRHWALVSWRHSSWCHHRRHQASVSWRQWPVVTSWRHRARVSWRHWPVVTSWRHQAPVSWATLAGCHQLATPGLCKLADAGWLSPAGDTGRLSARRWPQSWLTPATCQPGARFNAG